MAQSVILALGVSDATSTAIAVTTTPVTVGIYGVPGKPPVGYACYLEIDSPVTGHVQVYDEEGEVILTQGRPQTVISAPGNYYVRRQRLVSTTDTIGIYVET